MLLHFFVNGKITTAEEAVIPLTDVGLLRGYAVFDFLRTYNKKPFRINDYLSRFENSASSLNIPLRFSKNEIAETIRNLISKSEITQDVGIRLLQTGGHSEDSITISKPSLFIILEKLSAIPSESYEKGVKLITHEFMREHPSVKHTNYKEALLLEKEKKNQGAFEILYTWNGNILEATRNNFFMFIDDILVTPVKNILHGVTRKCVLEIATGKFRIAERDVRVEEIKLASEAFTTGTTKGVLPVVTIDDQQIGDGNVGTHTKKLMELFEKSVSKSDSVSY